MQILFLVCAYFAEIIGTVAGFGSSTIALPLALFFFDFKTALVLVAFLHIFGNISRVSFFHQGLKVDFLIKFGLPSILASIVGALLVNFTSQTILKGALGIFLVVYATISFVEHIKIKNTKTNAIIGGGFSGFLAGLIGTGGALRAAFLTAYGLPKISYVATMAVIAIGVDLTRLPVYLINGYLTQDFIWYIPALLFIALAGSYSGKILLQKIAQKEFRKFVLVAIFIIGVYFVVEWLGKINL